MAAPNVQEQLKQPNGTAAAAADGDGGGCKEGENLLGPPTFKKLEDGRYRCVETGHELPDHAMDSYSQSKRCRIGLIDFALANNNPLLNMFKQDPLNRSKLICKLTGDSINKSEEHIWKHMSGRRFINKLEKMETGMIVEESGKPEKKESIEKENGTGKKKMEKKKKKKEKKKEEIISEMRDSPDNSDSEEPDFWMPRAGERWDFDDGGDRWGSDADSEEHPDEDDGTDVETEERQNESKELSKRTKRMSIEIGPSSFATRKKKGKKMAS